MNSKMNFYWGEYGELLTITFNLWCNPRSRWKKGYDHATAWFQVEVWNEFEEMLQECEKDYGEQKKEDSLSVIKDFLLEDMFIISDECKSFISEMSTLPPIVTGKQIGRAHV